MPAERDTSPEMVRARREHRAVVLERERERLREQAEQRTRELLGTTRAIAAQANPASNSAILARTFTGPPPGLRASERLLEQLTRNGSTFAALNERAARSLTAGLSPVAPGIAQRFAQAYTGGAFTLPEAARSGLARYT